MSTAQVYYDDRDMYDGDPGWILRTPGEVCDMLLAATTWDEVVAELNEAGYDDVELVDIPDLTKKVTL